MSPAETSLAKLDQARQMLAEARTLEDVKHVHDLAEAARTYAKAAHLGRESQQYAAEIALLASRKAGSILSQLEKSKGGDGRHHPPDTVAAGSEYAKALEETATPERTARRWQE